MTSVTVGLITSERKTPKNMTKGGVVRMSQASVPKIHTDGEGDRRGGGGGGWVDWVELVGAITSVEHHPGTGVLDRKTHFVKFNSYRIFTCKRTNGNKVLNNVRRDKYIRK